MIKTLGQQLQNDRRVKQAKGLLLAALKEQQAKMKPRPAHKHLQKHFDQLIAKCSQLRGGQLYYPYLSSGLGKGPLVELADGSVKYDFITGIGVYYLGHSHPKLLSSSIDAALEDTLIQGNLQQSTATVEILELIMKTACQTGAALKHCFLTSSGAMANENGLKIIFQKHAPAKRILAFQRAFAGRSMVTAQITDKAVNRAGLPKVLAVDYVPFYDPAKPQESIRLAKAALLKHLKKFPRQHAGMMFELIQGEGGYYPGSREFFVTLMKILKDHKRAILVDEIQTFGRTSEAFAFQHFGLDKYVDVVTIGKMLQVCATLFREEYKPQPGFISQTFTASSSSIHAAKTIIQELLGGGYLGGQGKIQKFHQHFVARLEGLAKKYPCWVRGPFGCGAMVAVTVLDGKMESAKEFLKILFQNGAMAFVAGHEPVRIRFLIPVGAVTFSDIDRVCELLEKSLLQTAKGMKLENPTC